MLTLVFACEGFLLSPQDLSAENHGNEHLDKGVGCILFNEKIQSKARDS